MSFLVRNITLLAVFMILFATTGCKKENFSERVGFVVWSGEYIDGGCGWLISFHTDLQYQPWNLPDALKVDSVPVRVIYKDLKKRPDCLNRTDVDGQIYIHKIENVL
jgi:hypothetical protein